MGKISILGLPNKFKGYMDGVSYDLDGRIFLTPDNLIPWGDLVGVSDQGGPQGLGSLLAPFFPTGINLYAGFSLGSMVRQNSSPLPLDQRHVFMLPTIVTEGHAPPSESEANLDQQAFQPLLSVAANTQSGFAANTYQMGFTGIDEGGRHTLIGPIASQVVPANNVIVLVIPDWARSYAGLGVWMSQPGWFSQGPLYLQDTIDFATGFPDTYDLFGPFTAVKTAPSVNETYLGRTSNPTVTSGVASSFDLGPGSYQVFATLVTKTGEALPNQTAVTVTVASTRTKSTITVEPTAKPAGVTGWKCYVKLADGKTYLVYQASSTPEKPLLLSEKAELYSTDPGGWGQTNWRVSQKDLPTVDTSGLPKPDMAPYETTTRVPDAIPSGSVVHVMATLTDGDQEGPRSSPTSIAVNSAGQMVKGTLPKVTQMLPNPEGLETDSAGLPLNWTVRQTPTVNGTVTAIEGEFTLALAASTTAEAASVWIQPTQFDKTLTHTFVAHLEAQNTVSGRIEIALLEYSTATPTYPTTAPTRTTVIESVSADGTKEVRYTIAPSFWLAGTLSWALVYRITDASGVTGTGGARQLTGKVRHAGLFPHEHVPRKWADPVRGVAALAEQTVSAIFSYVEGALARIGFPLISLIPPITLPWNRVRRPLQTGTIQEEVTFEGGTIPGTWTQIKTLGGVSSSDPGLTLAVNSGAALAGGQGLQVKDTTTSAVAELGIQEALSGAPRHRAGIGALVSIVTAGASGRRDLLEITTNTGAAIGRIYQDQNRHVFLEYRNGATLTSRRIFSSVALNTLMDLDLSVSGSGTNTGIVSAWGVLTSGTRVLLGRFERLNLIGYPAERVWGGTRGSVAADTWETRLDRIRITDGGQSWYRDHNADGLLLGQAHLFMPRNATSTQQAFLKDVEEAVKPGQRYGIGAFLEYTGVSGTSYPLQIMLHRLNGETVSLGSLLSPGGTGGISGTAAWQEYLRDVTIPAQDPADPLQDIYKLTMDSRDIGVGSYTLQEIAMSELTPIEALAVKRTGRGRTHGVYIATLDTETPKREGAPKLPKHWVRAAADLESLPANTTFALRLRTSGNLVAYSGYATDLADLIKNKYLEFEMTFDSTDGRASPVLAATSPGLDVRFYDTVLLREDGSELPGGIIVNNFSGAYDDPQYEVRTRHSGHSFRQAIAEPVPWTDGFDLQLFTKEAMDEIRENWPKGLYLVESEQVGESVKVMLLDKPEFDPRTDLFQLASTGEYYRAYVRSEIDECEVIERLVPPGL